MSRADEIRALLADARDGIPDVRRAVQNERALAHAVEELSAERDRLTETLREADRWKALLTRNVTMMRDLCDDDPAKALGFIEGMVTGRVAMIVPPDMVPPEEMEAAIRRGQELSAKYGWDDPAALAVPSEDATGEASDPAEGLPPDLQRALRDAMIRLPQDDVKMADGRSLFDHLNDWRNAPSNTASTAASEDATGEGSS